MKKITLRDFVKLSTDDSADGFVFATQNQPNPGEYGFSCLLRFPYVDAMPEQNLIIFSGTDSSYISLSNVSRVEIGEYIPGCGTPINIVVKRFLPDSVAEKTYVFVTSRNI
jgi:hypothetical protein